MKAFGVRPQAGYTLIELLTVIAVVGILVGLILSAVQNVRNAAMRLACSNNLRQVSTAFHLYHGQYGRFPPSYGPAPELGRDNILTWPVRILPFIEQDNLWAQSLAAHRADPIDFHNPPHVGLTTVVKVYSCPSDGRLLAPITDDRGYNAAYGSYIGVAGSDRANGAMRAVFGVGIAEISDGSSSTLLIGEKPPWGRYLDGNWYTITTPSSDPNAGAGISYLQLVFPTGYGGCSGSIQFGPGRLTNPCDNYHFWSLHTSGAHFAFADGSVHFLRYSSNGIMPALATRAGGETVEIP